MSAVYWCISIIEKEKKVAGRMTTKGRGPGKMPWRTVDCRPLLKPLGTVGMFC